MENITGNLTTIIKFIIMTLAPAIGLEESMNEPLVAVIVGLIGFILAYFDARYNNTLISKEESDDTKSSSDSC